MKHFFLNEKKKRFINESKRIIRPRSCVIGNPIVSRVVVAFSPALRAVGGPSADQ